MTRQHPHHRRPARRRPTRPDASSTSAREHGIDIPTLCHLDGLSDVGACRLCLVEVAGATAAAAGLRHRASPRAWRSRPTPERLARVSPDDRRAAVRRAQPRLLRVRGQRPLRAAGPGRATCGMDHVALRLPATRPSAWTSATRASASTTTAASSAPAACGSATRSRAPTPGTSPAAASTRASSPTWTSRGASRPTCTSCGKCVQACPTGALFEQGRDRRRDGASDRGRSCPSSCTAREKNAMDTSEARHRLARRLLGLPHVVPRPGRVADRPRRAGRPRLQPARSTSRSTPRASTSCLVEGAVANEEDLRDDPAGPRADADPGLVRRLRRDRQRARRCATRSARRAGAARAPTWRTATLNAADPDARSCRGCCRRSRPVHDVVAGRLLPAGLPAAGRPASTRAAGATCSPGGDAAT